ncbi:SAM-dependent methyltransferase [Pseudofrankia sp. DC12]|uniref:SAM-dependent methyltransferase n=1 Tax=Pseudofrankia sp. DC12 TaxID=683315 RepID=UPI001E473F6B|nr:SAM-dependent methyltransferase [Pseudofrankia sp. DC12]
MFATDLVTLRRVADRLRATGPASAGSVRPVCVARAGGSRRRDGTGVVRIGSGGFEGVGPDGEYGPLSGLSGSRAVTAVDLRTDVAHAARVYNYLTGGKDHFPADRLAAERALAVVPDLRTGALENRAFLLRAARVLAEDGIDQYLDVGTGLPADPNLHEVVQRLIPAARVAYVDNDPLVLAHARALLTSRPEGVTAYVDADVRRPADILRDAGHWLDLSRPVAVCVGALLHFIPDEDDPAGMVADLLGALAPGSCLVLSHGTGDFRPKEADAGVRAYRDSGITVRVRSRAEVTALVPAGMRIGAPGVVPVQRWRPDHGPGGVTDGQVGLYGLLARKP